jgi:hypothetical protein
MRKEILLALLFSTALAACGEKAETAPVAAPAPVVEAAPQPPAEDDVYVKTAKKAVLGVLKDPGSAQFEDVKGSVVGGDPSVCGKVNSKNARGGYVGFKQFCWTQKNGLMPFMGE